MASIKFLLCILALASATSVAICSSWEPCNKRSNYEVKIKDVIVEPDPVISGKDVTFIVHASSGVPIGSGKVIITVRFLNIPVYNEVDNLCDKTTCPIPAGSFVLNNTQALPSIAPPGSYKIRMQIVQGSTQLACADIKFRIVWSIADQYNIY